MRHLLLALLLAPPIAAQHPTTLIFGRVVRLAGVDSLVAAGAEVTLHHVSLTASGRALDSVRADRRGGYSFRVTPDSGVYLISARWSGIEYFAPPIPADAMDQSVEVLVVVVDGAPDAPLTLVARQIVITAPAPDGTREVVDGYTFAAPGPQARIPSKPGLPTWRVLLPAGAIDPAIGDSDFADDAFVISNDTLALMAGIPPGRHALLVGYRLPAGISSFTFPALEAAVTLTVMAEEPGITPAGLERGDTATLGGHSFTEWSGSPSLAEVTLTLPWDGTLPDWFPGALIGLMGLGLVGAVVLVFRRERSAGKRDNLRTSRLDKDGAVEVILSQISLLDREYAGSERRGGEWSSYLSRRAQLKEELSSLLAGKNRTPPPAG